LLVIGISNPWLTNMWTWSVSNHGRSALPGVKKTPDPNICLAQEAEIQELIATFGNKSPKGSDVAELEVLVRTAIFKPANDLVGMLLQKAANGIDAALYPQTGRGVQGARASAGARHVWHHLAHSPILLPSRKEMRALSCRCRSWS